MRAMTALLVVAAWGLGSAAISDDHYITSETGLYQVVLTPEPEVVGLGVLHAWRLVVRDAEGPVAGAVVSVDGGMPMHGHGLPTAPQVVDADTAGHYRIEGLRPDPAPMSGVPRARGSWCCRASIAAARTAMRVTANAPNCVFSAIEGTTPKAHSRRRDCGG